MISLLNYLTASFIPHGHCYLWKPELVSLHAISDSLIGLAYYSIPAILIYFVWQRRDIPFNWIFLMFAAFIICCGTTHLLEVWTLWQPNYWISGGIKALTAGVSWATAVLLVPLMPRVLALPSLEGIERTLREEIAERTETQKQLSVVQNELVQQLADMTRLHDLSARLSTTLELQPVLEEVLAAVTSLQQSQMGVLMLYDAERDDLYTVASMGFSEEYLHRVGRVSRGVGACGTVLETGEPCIIEDVERNLRFAPYLEAAHLAGYRAVYSVPLLSARGEIIGTLATYFPMPHRPSPRDIALVELYARQAGWAIENAQLYQSVATARAEAEANARALAQSEAQYRMVGEAIPFGIWICGADGGTRYISQTFLDLVGMTLEECQQFGWMSALPPEDVEPTLQAWQHCVETGELWDWEHRFLGADGEYRTVLSRGLPVRDRRGEIASWVGINLDISDRKQMERERLQLLAELATKQQLLEAVLQQMPAGVVVAEAPTGKLLLMNEQVKHILKNDRSFVAQGSDRFKHQIFYPDGHPYPASEVPLARAIASGEVTIDEEVEIRREDGSRCTILASAAPIRDRAEEIVAGVVTFYDISDRKRVEKERELFLERERDLRQQAEQTTQQLARLQYVTAALSEALTAEEIAETIVTSGLAALGANVGVVSLLSDDGTELENIRIVGYPSEIINSWSRVNATANVPIADAVRTGSPIWIETKQQRDERYPHLAQIHAVGGSGALVTVPMRVNDRTIGGLGLGFPQDRTFKQEERAFILALAQQCAQAVERSRLFEAERAARAEAEAANRMKDEFLAILSHELRTPLNPILGWAKLLKTRTYDAATAYRALDTIERNAKLQAQLIEDLLDVSRILRGKLSLNVAEVDLVGIVEAAIETLRLAAQTKAIAIHTHFEDNSTILGDANRLQQAIWNLLSNAVKFTPEGGRIDIALECVGDRAIVRVADTGIGIAPEFLPFAFERFRQADSTTTRTFGGLGLGLAIVRHLVELHGGTVEAESPGIGQGATFTIALPLVHLVSLPEVRSTDAPHCLDLNSTRILVVDDDEDTLEIASFILDSYGATVRSVRSVREAIAALPDFQPHLAISDIGMPEMDGYQFIEQLKTLAPEQGGQIPAIALTAYAAQGDRDRILAAGFAQHLSKPVEPEELVAAIVRQLDRDR